MRPARSLTGAALLIYAAGASAATQGAIEANFEARFSLRL
jgi:hypothetical protein